MKQVHVIIDRSRIVDYLISPLKYNRKLFKDKGYSFKFYNQVPKSLGNCDIALFVSKAVFCHLKETQTILNEESVTVKLLKEVKQKGAKVIWIDNSDSTTVTHFELLPYIDLYLKKQLLKDKTLYKNNFVGGRIFTDYYHKHFNIEDDTAFKQFYPLDMKQAHKVSLSWNIGLGKMYDAFTKYNALRIKYPGILPYNNNPRFFLPEIKKENDIFIRTSTNLKRKLVAFHRQELLKRLNDIIKRNNLSGSVKGKWLSDKEFKDALKSSKILPSPFGWGEIGVRDYEAFIYGAVLLKPDVSHMVTWPPLFGEEETYQPFKWNFGDLEDKILELLSNKEKRIRIAQNGQEAYRNSISREGMYKFCDWFIKQIEK